MSASQQEPAYRNPQLPVEQRVADLLDRMTVEEKVAQLQTSFSTIAHLLDEEGNFNPEKAKGREKEDLGIPPSRRRGPREMAEFNNAIQKYALEDTRLGIPLMTVGEALLSPTRLYAPIAKAVLEEVGQGVHGMVHNTGGGQTKCIRLGRGVRYVKDGLPEPDPVFRLIQRESDVEWREMYQDFNMGVGYEFIVSPDAVDDVLSVSERYGFGGVVVGHCEPSRERNSLEIRSPYGEFTYP